MEYSVAAAAPRDALFSLLKDEISPFHLKQQLLISSKRIL
jgi:hypothetical protein